MSNQQLIKSAHIWFLALLLGCGVWAMSGKAEVNPQDQNSNQNSNSNANANSSRSQNRNANRSANRNTGATGEQAGMTNMSSQDHNFIMDAAMGGLMEVELGRVATEKGASEAVKQFGQRMVDDHSKANAELMSLASSKGMTLPTAIDEKHREQVTKLSAMSGAEFDRAYINMMVSDHNKDVAEFEKESTKGGDPDLKAFATKTLPTLKEHQQMAKVLHGNQSGNSNSNSRSSNRNSNGNSNRP